MTSSLDTSFRLFPEQASTMARQVDHLFYYLLGVLIFFTLAIMIAVIYLAVRYRRRDDNEFPAEDVQNFKLGIIWTISPFFFMLVMFFWGASLYGQMMRPPENTIVINVVGKQWMWKIQHPEGVREINELHVPIGQPIKLMLASQDVIHSFFIPAFRIKHDVVPGSFAMEWFIASKPGTYHLFCSQYCGTEHAEMIGHVVAMEPGDYAAWLSGVPKDTPPAAAGAQLFVSWGCNACHGERAPTMAGLYMTKVPLDNGSSVIADDDYLRESIIEPSAKVVAGYPAIMPSYRGQLSEEQLMALVAFIKSQGASAAPSGVRTTPSTRPVNGQSPDYLPNFPPARQPVPAPSP
ncbi:MAG TPA: cytochrome c oxidase subunit II [Tepidisphaeraceae bacterium]|jgi:cytochrome c oxidase subunit 2|nr:cytochrome c oxidase subunit II [Tepidisphaeraceae bacterium]